MMDNDRLIFSVKELLSKDNSGHGFDHVERVYKLAIDIAEKENADKEIVSLASLLHDCDDYKLFGQEVADNLSNSRAIMDQLEVDKNKQDIVLEIIANMGYSKSLKGIRPTTLEGKIVSDADMLEAMGVMGTIRCLMYAWQKKSTIFDENVFPEVGLSIDEYKKPYRKANNFINHFFEKLLKLKGMMFTKAAKEEAEIRHKFMLEFLYQYFRENNVPEWIEYLENYEKFYSCS